MTCGQGERSSASGHNARRCSGAIWPRARRPPSRRRCSAARGLSPAGQLPGREPRTNGQTAASQRSSGATVGAYVPARHRRAGPGILRLHRARGKVPVGQTLPGGDGRVAADWRGSLSVIRSQGRVEPGSSTLSLLIAVAERPCVGHRTSGSAHTVGALRPSCMTGRFSYPGGNE